jgi:hypothetical protein
MGIFLAGCTTTKTTTTARTATEQLLLSTATDHALQKIGLDFLSGRKVFLDSSNYDSYDSKYVIGTLRDALSRCGAILADSATNCDVIVEVRSGALAVNESDTMFGIPSCGIPIPLAGTVQTPEIAFYKSTQQRSYAKFALLVLARDSHAHIYSSGPLDGKSYDKHFRVIFVSWFRTDVPEAEKTEALAQKYQTWSPQNDPANLPPATGPGRPAH